MVRPDVTFYMPFGYNRGVFLLVLLLFFFHRYCCCCRRIKLSFSPDQADFKSKTVSIVTIPYLLNRLYYFNYVFVYSKRVETSSDRAILNRSRDICRYDSSCDFRICIRQIMLLEKRQEGLYDPP